MRRPSELRSNRSIDTDVLSAGFAGLLSAGHFQRYAARRLAKEALHAGLEETSIAPLLSPHGCSKFVRKAMRREPLPSGAVGFWPAPVSGARHSLPLQFLALRPMVTLGTKDLFQKVVYAGVHDVQSGTGSAARVGIVG